ncbi:MAG: hypothetical protein ABJG90_00155 [Nitratireductor sp.]
MIAIADAFSGQYANETAFMQALVDQLRIEMARRGWTGAAVHEVRWREARDGRPAAPVVIAPGHRPPEPERLREKFRDVREAAARRAEQGELL